MTREEAIYRLKNMAWLYGSVEREQNIEAIDMAIEALQADAVSREVCDIIAPNTIYCSPQIAENVKIVVQCKDCRFAMVRTEEEMNKPIKPQPILCEWLCIGVENDAYCSHGERRKP